MVQKKVTRVPDPIRIQQVAQMTFEDPVTNSYLQTSTAGCLSVLGTLIMITFYPVTYFISNKSLLRKHFDSYSKNTGSVSKLLLRTASAEIVF